MTLSSEEVEVNLCTVQGMFFHNKIDDHLSNVILKVEFTKNVAMQCNGYQQAAVTSHCYVIVYCIVEKIRVPDFPPSH